MPDLDAQGEVAEQPEEILRSLLNEFGLERMLLDDPVHAETTREVRFYLAGLLDGMMGRMPRVKWAWDAEQEANES